ncbi:MAG TPA: LuxR C-terminal-related transcriptional regulator [Flavobacteriales bacterium]|nr:LuxR C-terminal-related transcriptional regulator [Flavobacteriales bacterium]HRE97516.1 LuxR C-terminal-related transcriptional regulator [Flavobacteriales bacterium]HRJ37958.1 LuxR C-terminal-related transcriptional regulator [Flavobacteriales bacterium]
MHNKTIKVAIAEGDCFFSILLRHYFESNPDFNFSDHLRTYEEVVNYEKWESVILLLNYTALGANGVKKIRGILDMHPNARILCYSIYYDPILEIQLINNGAKGLFSIDDKIDTIFRKITIASLDGFGLKIRNKSFTKSNLLFQDGYQNSSWNAKEKEIIKLLCLGKSSKEISKVLGLTLRSVQSYIARIKQKANCKTSNQLIITSIERGWNI